MIYRSTTNNFNFYPNMEITQCLHNRPCLDTLWQAIFFTNKQMAILESNKYGWIICHETFINLVYSNTKYGEKYITCTQNPVLFEIFKLFRNGKNQSKDDSEVKLIKSAYENLRELFKGKMSQIEGRNNIEAKCFAQKFYNMTAHYPDGSFSGGNVSNEALLTIIGSEKFLIPKKCVFYSYDIKDISNILNDKSFDFILMDPPWWNKSIRRKKKANSGYSMLYDSDLINIPINSLLNNDGIIAVWCTSAPSHINAVLSVLFPAWNLKFISQWFWLKVTKHGEPVCAFSKALGKQPYERIIFGSKINSIRRYSNPENEKVIMSTPSAIHSHKPPLCELIKPYIPENSECLELFARYLLPHWTSYGNEVLKLQHFSLYNERSNDPELKKIALH